MTDERGNLTSLEREGLAWADRIAVDSSTAADFVALEHWCALSPQHLAAFESAVELQALLADHQTEITRALDAYAPPPRPFGLMTRRAMFGGGAIAAGLAAYAAYNPPLHLWPSMRELGARFRTNRAETKMLALNGAHIEFDRATAATTDKGQLQLIEGAVLVDASSLDRLDVSSDEGAVTAHRARLNLARLDEVSCLTCLSGQVDLIHAASGRKLSLVAGQQVQYSKRSLETIAEADLESTLAWRHGLMVFSETPLTEVLKQINHYRGGRIVLTNAAVAEKRFTGVFKIGDFNRAISDICSVTGVKTSSLPGGIVLMG